MVKMHNNQNILTLLFIIILINTKSLINIRRSDTNKALYIIYAPSTTVQHIPHTPPMQQIVRYHPW